MALSRVVFLALSSVEYGTLSSDSTILRVVLLPGEVLGKHGQCWPCVLTFRGGKDYSAQVELFEQCVTVVESRIIDNGKRQ